MCPAAMEAIHAEVQATRYRRSFALSGELDAERIEATLKERRADPSDPETRGIPATQGRGPRGLTGSASTAPDGAPFGSLTAAPRPAAKEHPGGSQFIIIDSPGNEDRRNAWPKVTTIGISDLHCVPRTADGNRASKFFDLGINRAISEDHDWSDHGRPFAPSPVSGTIVHHAI